MIAHTAAPTVLIVDDDLAFLWWLGEVFAEAGYQAAPALHCRQALLLSKRLKLDVDLLVVNPNLTGAARMLEVLALENPGLPVILILNRGEKPHPAIQAEATLERPSGWEPVSRTHWQRKLRGVLRHLETPVARS
ncbi:MAG TPA: hypothetical protein VMU80_09555 [Bryobacteraceae bacterium]|nr:hypothetical protein [Bryobacteraceae bacterium]HUO29452.1 hypothetical protein [Bryobacteraceae bacterium]